MSEYTITSRSEGLLGWIGKWGAALVTDEELLEALAAHDAEKDRLAEAVQAAYNALHMETRERAIAILHDALSGVVAEEPEGRRWFSAAYRAQNGNVIAIGGETVLAEFAQKTVDEFSRADGEGPDYFLASRILSPWVPVKQEGTTDAS